MIAGSSIDLALSDSCDLLVLDCWIARDSSKLREGRCKESRSLKDSDTAVLALSVDYITANRVRGAVVPPRRMFVINGGHLRLNTYASLTISNCILRKPSLNSELSLS